MTKRRLTAKAKTELDDAKEDVEELEEEITALQAEMEQALEEVETKWAAIIEEVSEVSLTPTKKNIVAELFGIAWLPHYLVQAGDGSDQHIPAFG